MDRLKFTEHDGPTDIATMTSLLQLKFQCDADLADNVICWKSTDQGSISSSTAESEIKAVNHALKSDVIPLRGILNHMEGHKLLQSSKKTILLVSIPCGLVCPGGE